MRAGLAERLRDTASSTAQQLGENMRGQRSLVQQGGYPKQSNILHKDFDNPILNFLSFYFSKVISIKHVGMYVRFHLLFNSAHLNPEVDNSFSKNSAFTRYVTKVLGLLHLWFLKMQFSALELPKKYSIYRSNSIFIIYFLGQFSFLLFVGAFVQKRWGQFASWYKSECSQLKSKVMFFSPVRDSTIIMLNLLHLHIQFFHASCHNHSST